MQSKIVDVVKEPVEKPFPKLMKYDDIVVFFHKARCGTVIHRKISYSVGHYSDGWSMLYFQDFDGTIQLSND